MTFEEVLTDKVQGLKDTAPSDCVTQDLWQFRRGCIAMLEEMLSLRSQLEETPYSEEVNWLEE